MIARASQLFLPTLRDDPADAEAASHKLLVRGGFIRQVGAGLWTFMPLGWRVHRRSSRSSARRWTRSAAQELFAPVLTPAELWEADRPRQDPGALPARRIAPGATFVLPLTHEETFTFHARELQSYKQLPQLWYHFQTKDRDEPRPRGGLLRVREFIMKDSYSFDRDEAGLDDELPAHREAPTTGSSSAAASTTYDGAGRVGDDGRQRVGRLPRAVGIGREHARHVRERRLRGRPRGRARRAARAGRSRRGSTRRRRSRRRASRRSRRSRSCSAIDAAATSKAMPVTKEDGTVVLALVRGDDRLEEAKLARGARRATCGPPTEDEIRAAFGADPARSARSASTGEMIADEALREGQFVAGANRTGWHLRGVEARPRLRGALRRPARVRRRATGARVRRRAAVPDRDRGRPHLQARHALLGAARRDVPRRGRRARSRSSWAATASAPAASWPPRSSSITTRTGSSGRGDRAVRRARRRARRAPRRSAEQAARGARRTPGSTCCSTTATLRAGEKFADADLIGCPIRVTVGKKTLEDGKVDVRDRATGDERRLDVADLGKERLSGHSADVQRRSRSAPTIERLMDETGVTYRGLAAQDGPLGRLSEPPRARQPAGAVERRGRRRSPSALGVEPEHFREYRLRVITERLEAMPDLVDRLYKRFERVGRRAYVTLKCPNMVDSCGRQ